MGELAEPWSTAAEQAGVRQTYRGIGDAAGVSHVTVRRLIAEGRTTPSTIRKVADALRVEIAMVYKWANISTSEWGPWDPPMQAHQLNPRARAALEELILAVTEGGQSWDVGQSGPEDEAPTGRGTSMPTTHPKFRGGASADAEVPLAARRPRTTKPSKLRNDPQAVAGEEDQSTE